MIELELPKKISKDLILLFDFMLDPDDKKSKTDLKENNALFSKIYSSDAFTYNAWTKAIVMYSSWKNNKTEDMAIIAAQQQQQGHYIISETRNFVLGTIN
jgi:hypothetical protein